MAVFCGSVNQRASIFYASAFLALIAVLLLLPLYMHVGLQAVHIEDQDATHCCCLVRRGMYAKAAGVFRIEYDS